MKTLNYRICAFMFIALLLVISIFMSFAVYSDEVISSPKWRAPVANAVSLPDSDTDGVARIALDTHTLYIFNVGNYQ